MFDQIAAGASTLPDTTEGIPSFFLVYNGESTVSVQT